MTGPLFAIVTAVARAHHATLTTIVSDNTGVPDH
jgi:hypothetical protein